MQVVVAALFADFGITGMDGGETVFSVGIAEIQAREILQVGFGDDDFLAVIEFD